MQFIIVGIVSHVYSVAHTPHFHKFVRFFKFENIKVRTYI